ncbi:MAG: tyrosine-protein phosphatase, partial [Bacteroidales bacterium]|nr:tyrosine-protein phosphatase [Bacteroidales bacterium]
MAASLSVSAQQFLPVKSIVNARDLGGYAVQDGRKIRDGLLLRAAHIADATDADIRFLSGLPVS